MVYFCNDAVLRLLSYHADGATFDYIVVGAGGGGAAAAARLALAGHDVLLVEAGGLPGVLSKVPGFAPALMGSSRDWQYETIPNNVSCLSNQRRQCRFSRGKLLGGSTSINFMIYTRGSPRDYDDLNIPGWTWEDVKPYFLKYEGLQDLDKLPESSIPYHNTSGTMKLQFFSDSGNPWHPRVIDGFRELNFPFNPDVNAESQVGVTQVVGYVYDNERMSTARGYLARPDVKKALKVHPWTRCTGLILDANNTVRGIKASFGLLKWKLKYYARKEVILSAGTIGTPQILMLSGIGPAEHLKQMNIPVRVDLPVGDNMTDHLLPLVFIKVKSDSSAVQEIVKSGVKTTKDVLELLLTKSGALTSNGLTDVCSFLNSHCYDFENRRLTNDRAECELATLQYIHSYMDRYIAHLLPDAVQQGTGLDDNVIAQLKKLSADYAFVIITPVILKPYSQGTVRLASADPLAAPAIFPNFLADERDLDEMVKSLIIIEHLMDTPTYKKQNASIAIFDLPGCPDYATDSLGYWRCYSRHLTHTVYHAVGTACVGRVLDGRLRVRGVRRLRVADLSALPALPRGNTAASAIAIGERVADFILNGDD
ncbi:uncharacterized protein LOC114354377 isoform X1 [Ostrinia furnacalis]|uniref:uncharacterized protein LOC114354377 isoform X1 n=2 Tax=Ostrinia furnacalis TaxID=93504 RepID=UPI00103B0159|nr:uncharacterized protein LOC114354377 isoform X1 [Ostrinia furnacalis]